MLYMHKVAKIGQNIKIREKIRLYWDLNHEVKISPVVLNNMYQAYDITVGIISQFFA